MSIETAKAKLQAETESCDAASKAPVTAIVSFFREQMDDELAALISRETYTVSEMWDYVFKKAREALKSTSGCLPDEVVFGFATDYYHAGREEIDKLLHPAVKTPEKPATVQKTDKDANTSIKVNDVPKTDAVKRGKTSPAADGQLSLFDFGGI